ncbi:MAG: VOC family protein [Candidatus Peribacteria bacterium]|nr:MAG: VOC family protein [Candidatus Peribacteria bacterium]
MELAEYYVSIFPDAKISKQNPVVVSFEIFGQSLACLNGGMDISINPAISLSVWVETPALARELWDKLIVDGKSLMAYGAYPRSSDYGWLQDKYGVSRQIMYYARPGQKNMLVPSLMYTQEQSGRADEAIALYTEIFPNSDVTSIFRYGPDEQDVEGNIAHAEISLNKQTFIVQESSLQHEFRFNEGISLSISCADQTEVDFYREKLTAEGGEEGQC